MEPLQLKVRTQVARGHGIHHITFESRQDHACVRVHGELDERHLHPVYRNQEGDMSDRISQPDL